MKKKVLKVLSTAFICAILLSSCSNSNNEIVEKYNSIEKRYSLFMSYEGCVKNITVKNIDTNRRSAQIKIVSFILPETFKFLNEEINFLKTVKIDDENKEIVEKYNSKISTLFSEHVKIFRLFFVELSNKKSDYWGKLSLEGSNYDILKQIYENKTQKSVINMEKNNLILMRFKKVIMVSPDKAIEELNITSLSDYELVPMKI